MRFADKLNNLLSELNLPQTKLAGLTGISKAAISQYLSGKHEPSWDRKVQIARALGMEDDYFRVFLPEPEVRQDSVNLPVVLAARLMGKSPDFVKKGLQDGVFPWGYGVKMKSWSYWISAVKFTEFTGIEVPMAKEK